MQKTKGLPDGLQSHLVSRYGPTLYNRLHKKGANMGYIWYLDVRLQISDAITAIEIRRNWENKKARKRKSPSPPPASPFADLVSRPLKKYLEGWLASARELHPSDPILHPEHPEFHSRTKYVVERGTRAVMELLLEEHKKRLKKQNPFVELEMEYVPLPGEYRTGGTQDLRGSWFLLAVTEHLREKQDCYSLASQLLKKIRGTEGKERTYATTPRERVMKRIKKLMTIRPKWKAHLNLLTELYLLTSRPA